MDYDEVGNLTNVTFEHDISIASSLENLTYEIVFTICIIIGICADLLIIYTMFRFSRLRTLENILIANWAIADLGSLIVTPCIFRIISVIDHEAVSSEFICILLHIGTVFHLTEIIIVLILTTHWLFSAYFPRMSEKLKYLTKYLIGSIWIITIINALIATGICLNRSGYSMFAFGAILIYLALLLLIIVLQCVRGVRGCLKKPPPSHPTLTLTLTTVFTLCWFFGSALHMGIGYSVMLTLLAECLIFGIGMINLALLYYFNNDFHACLLQVCKCRRHQYQEDISNVDMAKNRNLVEIPLGASNNGVNNDDPNRH